MGYITIDFDRCKECCYCMKFCPKKLIHKGTKLNKFSYYPPEVAEGCTACGICATVCPDAAITVYEEV